MCLLYLQGDIDFTQEAFFYPSPFSDTLGIKMNVSVIEKIFEIIFQVYHIFKPQTRTGFNFYYMFTIFV